MNQVNNPGMKHLHIKSIILLLILISCSDRAYSSGNTEISLELHHSHANKVYLVYIHQGALYEKQMTRISDREYRVRTELSNGDYLFNLRSESSLYPGVFDWVGKPSGIDAEGLRINGTGISEDFLVKQIETPPAAFSMTLMDENVYRGAGDFWNPDERIPSELPQHHHYCRYRIPPAGFSAALPWMHAFHTGGEDSSSTVEVDYIKLYAHTSEGRVLLHSDDFSVDMSIRGYDHGGTYNRYPFFFNEEADNWPMPSEISDGALKITPDSHKNRVFHWWSSERTEVPDDVQYLVIETRVRITGKAIVQIGLDYWKDLTTPYAGLDINNTEAGVGDIIFPLDEPGWQEVSYSTEDIILWTY